MTARKVRLNHPREFGIGYHKNSLRPVLAMESYRFLGDEDIPYERYTSRAFYDLERLWGGAARRELRA